MSFSGISFQYDLRSKPSGEKKFLPKKKVIRKRLTFVRKILTSILMKLCRVYFFMTWNIFATEPLFSILFEVELYNKESEM